MDDKLITNCQSCGFRMHIEELSCLNCEVLADYREQALKAWIANRYRAANPGLYSPIGAP